MQSSLVLMEAGPVDGSRLTLEVIIYNGRVSSYRVGTRPDAGPVVSNSDDSHFKDLREALEAFDAASADYL